MRPAFMAAVLVALPAVAQGQSIAADTASVRVRCVVPASTTCRWTSSVGVAPDGIEAVFTFAAPAPGDSVQAVGTARAVRRGLVSATATPFAAWVKRNDVAPGAPDSVIVVEIIVGGGSVGPSAVTVDVATTHQTMEGFGTTVRLFDDPHLTDTFDPATSRSAVLIPPAAQDSMLAAAYTDLGLTRVRYATDPGVEWPNNDNADPEVVNPAGFNYAWKRLDGHAAYVAKARALGVTTWWGSPIQPEPWMNTSDVPEYVENTMQILRRWRDLGQPLPLWAIANEPDFMGARSPEFHRLAIRALGPRLATEAIPTRIVLSDASYPTGALPIVEAVMADPVARQYVEAIGVHLYPSGGTPGLPAYDKLDQVAALAQQYGVPLWMTEWSNPDYMRWAITMHELVTTYNVSAIDYMWAIFGQWESYQAGLMVLTYSGTTYTGFTKKPVYGALRQFSRYVRPGMVRVGATAPTGVLATAYTGAGEVVVVLVNPNAATTISLACGACGAFLGADRSTATTIGVPVPEGATYALPANSVTTLRFGVE